MRLPRVACPACRKVRTLEVPWARTGSRYTRAFEGQVAWLAQRMDLSSLARLTRCGWDAVHRIVARVVNDHLVEDRFEGLRRIGVDEVSYKKGHKYLTVVVDHDRRRVVWIGEGKSAETLGAFYDELGPQRCEGLEFVTMDGGSAYRLATTEHAPQAVICMDPFHVMKWAGEALDTAFGRSQIGDLKVQLGQITGNRLRTWRVARSTVRSGKEHLDTQAHKVLKLLRAQRRELYRDWELKEELRDLFSDVAPEGARAYLHTWLERARRTGSTSMFTLANRIGKHADMIIAAVENKLSNARLEGTNTRAGEFDRLMQLQRMIGVEVCGRCQVHG